MFFAAFHATAFQDRVFAHEAIRLKLMRLAEFPPAQRASAHHASLATAVLRALLQPRLRFGDATS